MSGPGDLATESVTIAATCPSGPARWTSSVDKMVSLFTASFEKFSAPPPPLPEPSAKRRPRDGAELAKPRGKRRGLAPRNPRAWLTE
eukprot:7703702-Pyramimonas_sp.AAC.1